MTGCKSMIEAFNIGGDFHSRTAMGMYGEIAAAVERYVLHVESCSRLCVSLFVMGSFLLNTNHTSAIPLSSLYNTKFIIVYETETNCTKQEFFRIKSQKHCFNNPKISCSSQLTLHRFGNGGSRGDVLLEWDFNKGDPPAPLLKKEYSSERQKAKILNFSIAYGKTPIGV